MGFSYIIYKLLNKLTLFGFCLTSRNYGPLLVCAKNIRNKNLIFDFSDETTHLGDRLFCFPLFSALLEENIPFCIKDPSLITQNLYHAICNKRLKNFAGSKDPIFVLPSSSLLANARKWNKLILIDFHREAHGSITDSIIASFGKLLDTDLKKENSEESFGRYTRAPEKPISQKFVLFNNYIWSGKFRKLLLNEQKLHDKCRNLRNLGFSVVHVGSAHERTIDRKLYEFVDLDLRGKLALPELVRLMASDTNFGAVTYDNFLMHLAGIFNKPAYVLFRGRLSRRKREHHFASINPTFFRNKSLIKYL
jgi:hypothetical protein